MSNISQMERDIDMVIVTGAGASTTFGRDGTPLRLMDGWSDALITKLQTAGSGYLEFTGLEKGLSGQAFEARLGNFLNQVKAFEQIASLLKPSVQLVQTSPNGVNSDQLEQWHSQTRSRLAEVTKRIHESLYEQFGPDRTDFDRAAQSYDQLLRALVVGRDDAVVVATTNYDLICEKAMEKIGRHPDWGVTPYEGPTGETPLRVDGMIGGSPRYTPVLHLHGRVGWYRRVDYVGHVQSEYSIQSSQFGEGLGVPIVMLPDPDKSYDGDDVINTLCSDPDISVNALFADS